MTKVTSSGAEYVDDVPYIRQFVSDLSPGALRLVAALNGLEPPPLRDFDYCEVGCGHGDTVCALAAAYPDARFVGVDINPEHIASAKRLARDGALENIGFLERDFGDLIGDDSDLGELDYIVAHGVLTWVSAEKRRQLLELACAKLKPGGLLFVSYNAMPGWASVEPLRQLLLSPVGSDGSGPALDRARAGLHFAQAMQAAGALYFEKNPSAAEMLATMSKTDLRYVVHEYMHDHWSPMYFARVAWEMAAHDLHFAGVMPAFLNFRDMAVPASLEGIFDGVKDRVTFEAMKDFAINEFFRRDVYVHGARPRTTDSTNAYLDDTPFAARALAVPESRKVDLPHRAVLLEGPEFDALLEALGDGAATLAELAARPALARFGIEKLRTAMVRLVVGDLAMPLRERTRRADAKANAAYRVPSVYNQTMVRRLSSPTPLVFVSELAGQAFPVSSLDVLAVKVLTEAPPDGRDAWIRDLVGKNVLRLRVGERVYEKPDEQAQAIREAVDRLVAHRLSALVELGVLVPL